MARMSEERSASSSAGSQRIQRPTNSRFLAAWVVGLGIAARLLLATTTSGNYDMVSYGIVSDIVRSGGNVYEETARYNYSPLWSFVLGVFRDPRIFLIGIDAATTALLATVSRSAALSFISNPVSIWITGFHGQFESVAILFLLAASFATSPRWSIGLSTAAVISKQSVALAPAFVLRRWYPRLSTRILILIGIASAFLLALLPWATSSEAVLGIGRNVLAYGVGGGSAGSADLLSAALRGALLLAVIAASALRWSHRDSLLAWALVTIATMPFAGIQLWVIAIAPGSLVGGRLYASYTAVAFVALLGHDNGAGMGWTIPWAVSGIAAVWLIHLWRSTRLRNPGISLDR